MLPDPAAPPVARAGSAVGLTLSDRIPTIAAMDEDLQALQERIERLLQNARRLADENRRLKAELAAAHDTRQRLERRMGEARSRVEAALSRLPTLADESSVARDAAH
jgi:uncharacterized protein (TIGR02449 family)